MTKVFGQPKRNPGSDGKVRMQWVGRIFGMVFTIYDYKETKPLEEMNEWHIGGKSAEVVELVNEFFKTAKAEVK